MILVTVFIISIISGFLSGTNIWVNSLSDMRIHLEDGYYGVLMFGWMTFIAGLISTEFKISYVLTGLLAIILALVAIRLQLFIGDKEYITTMIPVFSRVVMASDKILKRTNNSNINLLAKSSLDNAQKTIDVYKEI